MFQRKKYTNKIKQYYNLKRSNMPGRYRVVDFANNIGVTRNTVSLWFRGHNPNPSIWQAIEQELGISSEHWIQQL